MYLVGMKIGKRYILHFEDLAENSNKSPNLKKMLNKSLLTKIFIIATHIIDQLYLILWKRTSYSKDFALITKFLTKKTKNRPVLMTIWMTRATWPFRTELRTLTMKMRQEQSTMRDPASRIRPTDRSDKSVLANICQPAAKKQQDRRVEVNKTNSLETLQWVY